MVLGVLLGSAGTFDSTMQDVAEATGFSRTVDTSQLALAWMSTDRRRPTRISYDDLQ
jgi:hypothetical protein